MVARDGNLPARELEAIEAELCFQENNGAVPDPEDTAFDAADIDYYFAAARARIGEKIGARKAMLSQSLDVSIDPEIEKVKESCDRRIAELAEKLELLEAQFKWYGRNLKGTITRTKNLIEKAKNDRDSLLLKYKGYLGIDHDVELICAGILVSSQD